MLQVILLFLLSFLVSCSSGDLPADAKVGSCFSEDHKSWADTANRKSQVYKLEKVVNDQLVVSLWHNKNWFYKGRKPSSYFKENERFSYSRVSCPDGSSNVEIF